MMPPDHLIASATLESKTVSGSHTHSLNLPTLTLNLFCHKIPCGGLFGASIQVSANLIFLIKNARGGEALSLIQ